jgi:hypothetical protein
MTRDEAFKEINSIQNDYIDELIGLINNPDYIINKTINFTSATGTGKTKMMSKLINKLPDYFFIITTLSKGQLHLQVKNSLEKDCVNNNFIVYGNADYKINSILRADDIIRVLPKDKPCIWLRDEGHIRTNNFEELLMNICYKVINFSATNTHSDIKCKFSQTMMLRTVNQTTGTPEEAINKLLEVKRIHKNIPKYNPCAIFRCVGGNGYLYKWIVQLCEKNNLKYIDITKDEYLMSELCEDDNEYDVIINKFKITEGIDIRRAHVLYMDNQPSNAATTIQAIGRCRRNALLYRDDIDIFAPENKDLLEQTRECYVFYNVCEMKIDTDSDGELQLAFCNHITCEELKAGTTIEVINGQLPNGLYVIELVGKTGKYKIVKDSTTGFNVIKPLSNFYDTQIKHFDNNYLYYDSYAKLHISNINQFPLLTTKKEFDFSIGEYREMQVEPYYEISKEIIKNNVEYKFSQDILDFYKNQAKKYIFGEYIYNLIKEYSVEFYINKDNLYSYKEININVEKYILDNQNKNGLKIFCQFLNDFENNIVNISGFEYKLNDVCSKDELILLKEACIKQKNMRRTNDDIKFFIDEYIKIKSEYKRYKLIRYYKNHEFLKIFDNLSAEILPKDNLCDYIREFVKSYMSRIESDNNLQNFYILIRQLYTARNITIDIVSELEKCCDIFELEMIAYCCIKEKELGLKDEEIILYLEKILKERHNFYLSENTKEYNNITYLILNENLSGFYSQINIEPFSVKVEYTDDIQVQKNDISRYFEKIDNKLKLSNDKKMHLYLCTEDIKLCTKKAIAFNYKKMLDDTIEEVIYSYSTLFEDVSSDEHYMIRNRYIPETGRYVEQKDIENYKSYEPYDKIVNDKESAIIGVDLMKQIKVNNEPVWSEAKSVSQKVGNYNKLNVFITNKYSDELKQASSQYIRGKNHFELDTKCNSIIGYCVEYYSKYLVYGDKYLHDYIIKAQRESNTNVCNEYIIVRACMLKHREMMIRSFGKGVAKVIKSITIKELVKEKYKYFVKLVVELAEKTASYVKRSLYANRIPKDNIDTDLSIEHIKGLADYITEDTILDVKVRNNIDEKCIRQVLAYHYLSTKRSDLNIKKVIVYDAVSDKAVVVNISSDNIKK